MSALSAEIFVLNYNGRDLLAECLPSVIEAAAASPVPCPVTVIDNSSTDDSLQVLKDRFPDIRVLPLPNRVLCSFNDAARASKADIVFLLNNDLKLDKGFVAPLLRAFEEHSDAFLAAPKTWTFDNSRYEGSLSKMYFRFGQFGALSRFDGFAAKVDRPGLTMQSGFGAFHRQRFLELGGFDDLYLPGTVEDSDLGFRAYKKGYRGYYAPDSKAWHKGQATFKRSFSSSRLLALNQRNLYLFVWKNISAPELVAQHLVWLFIRPALFMLRGRFEFLQGLFMAMPKAPLALKKRRTLRADKSVLTDRQVFALSEGI